MRFTPQFLDELKARLPVSEVVGKRVALKKAGREWKGLSPFNKEKTASFFVNDQKAAWFDFSSQKNGNIFDFVMETEGVSFPEAVERLAAMAGVALPKFSKEEVEREEKRKSLHDVMELAAKFFEATLASRLGAKARGYLADRRLDGATQLKFRMGYAPNERYALKEHLGKQGVSVDDMIATGLLINGEDIPVPYDRFRDRVMFPIADFRGRIIAFGGRALDKDAPAKYLNSPETTLFHKGNNLYNGAAARQATHDGAQLIVVEGYVDVIAMVTAGYPATVAPLGTALTEEQLGLLWKMNKEPILCFDGDKAGQRAAYRAVDMALPRLAPGKSVRFALLPEGQDPDDLYRSGGREAIAEVLGSARGLADMLWTRETEAGAFDTPERRAALEARLKEIIKGIGDETVRRYYSEDFVARLRQLMAPKFDAPEPRRHALRRPPGGAPPERRARLAEFHDAQPRSGPGAFAAAQRQAVIEPDRARPPQRGSGARGAPPYHRGQPSVAAGKPRRGVRRPGVSQFRRRPAAPRHPGGRHRPSSRRDGGLRQVAGGARRARGWSAAGPRRGRDHAHVGLAHHGRDGNRRRGPMVDPRRHLAPQEAHAK